MTRDEAIEQGRREGIHPEDAGSMYDKLAELEAKVAVGEISPADLRTLGGNHARGIARKRKLLALMSPNLDVIAGKLR